MIGEIIGAEYHVSSVSSRRFIKCYVKVDGDDVWAFVSLDTIGTIEAGSNAIYLLSDICGLKWIAPSNLLHKLVPMCRNTFNQKTFWTFDWKQMRIMHVQDKKGKHERNYKQT